MRLISSSCAAILLTGCVSTHTVVMELSHPNNLGTEPIFVKATVGDSRVYVGSGEQDTFMFSPIDSQMRLFVTAGSVPISSMTLEVSVEDPTKADCKRPGGGVFTTPNIKPFKRIVSAPTAAGAKELMLLVDDIGRYDQSLCSAESCFEFAGALKAKITVVESDGKSTTKFPVTLRPSVNCPDYPPMKPPCYNPCP